MSRRTAAIQSVVVIGALVIAFVGFYVVRMNQLNAQATAAPVVPAGTKPASNVKMTPLGDLTAFIAITQDDLNMLNKGQQAQATARITDLETLWDNSEAVLKHRDGAAWTAMDGKLDVVFRSLRSTSPDLVTEKAALQALLTQEGVVGSPSSAG
jgi:hypothetical protein